MEMMNPRDAYACVRRGEERVVWESVLFAGCVYVAHAFWHIAEIYTTAVHSVCKLSSSIDGMSTH